ncbi:thioredoxin [bacterium]|nr:thioredoxin [bacterium]
MEETQLVRCVSCGATNRVSDKRIKDQFRAVCGRCKTPLSISSQPLIVTDTNFSSVVEVSSLPVLLDMWAEWCAPCHMLAPVIEQLSEELTGRVVVAKLNVDENPKTAGRFNVRGIPTLLLLKNGREIDRIVGVQPKSEIVRHLKQFF